MLYNRNSEVTTDGKWYKGLKDEKCDQRVWFCLCEAALRKFFLLF